ncbi:MAG: hypothetical protein LRY67_05215 [Gammaproteobacteria bacterium]|nr:hypothetical protein [Gammaproteobacteria bacterium]
MNVLNEFYPGQPFDTALFARNHGRVKSTVFNQFVQGVQTLYSQGFLSGDSAQKDLLTLAKDSGWKAAAVAKSLAERDHQNLCAPDESKTSPAIFMQPLITAQSNQENLFKDGFEEIFMETLHEVSKTVSTARDEGYYEKTPTQKSMQFASFAAIAGVLQAVSFLVAPLTMGISIPVTFGAIGLFYSVSSMIYRKQFIARYDCIEKYVTAANIDDLKNNIRALSDLLISIYQNTIHTLDSHTRLEFIRCLVSTIIEYIGDKAPLSSETNTGNLWSPNELINASYRNNNLFNQSMLFTTPTHGGSNSLFTVVGSK